MIPVPGPVFGNKSDSDEGCFSSFVKFCSTNVHRIPEVMSKYPQTKFLYNGNTRLDPTQVSFLVNEHFFFHAPVYAPLQVAYPKGLLDHYDEVIALAVDMAAEFSLMSLAQKGDWAHVDTGFYQSLFHLNVLPIFFK